MEENFVIYEITYAIEIEDNGTGIKKEDLKKLFTDFTKLDQSEGINKRGTGLGLSICKKIVEKMGGKIKVKSTLGEGTTFIIKMKTYSLLAKNDSFKNMLRQPKISLLSTVNEEVKETSSLNSLDSLITGSKNTLLDKRISYKARLFPVDETPNE